MRAEAWRQRILIIIIKRPAGDKIRTAYEQSAAGGQVRGEVRRRRRGTNWPKRKLLQMSATIFVFLHTFFSVLSLSLFFAFAMRSVFTLRYLLYYFRIRMRICGGRRQRERESRARSMIRGRRGCQLTAISARSSHEADRRRPPAWWFEHTHHGHPRTHAHSLAGWESGRSVRQDTGYRKRALMEIQLRALKFNWR